MPNHRCLNERRQQGEKMAILGISQISADFFENSNKNCTQNVRLDILLLNMPISWYSYA